MPIKPRILAYLLLGSVALLFAVPFAQHKWENFRFERSIKHDRANSLDVTRITVPRSSKDSHQSDYQSQVTALIRRGYTVQCTYPSDDDTIVVLSGVAANKPSPMAGATKERLRAEWQALVARKVEMQWRTENRYIETCPFCRVLIGQRYYSDQYPPSWPEEYCECSGERMHIVELKTP